MSDNEASISLLFDLGNTRAKWALAQHGAILEQGAFRFSDTALQACLDGLDVSIKPLGSSIIQTIKICSVANRQVLTSLQDGLLRQWGVAPRVVKVESRFEHVSNHYAGLEQLGVDRWVAVIGAAYSGFPGAKIVVDAGTAVTVDYLSSKDEYLGGAILPGRDLMLSSLNTNTANIKADLTETNSIFGRNTSECVNIGCQVGLNGAVMAIVQKMLAERPETTQVLLCGGGAQSLLDYLGDLDHSCLDEIRHVPNLIFDGLIALS